MPSRTNLKIDFANHKSALFACKYWHYSKSMPCPPNIKFGVWEKDIFIGVVIFSRGASPTLLNKYNMKQTDGCELTRIALTAHKTPVSRILSICLKKLKQKEPNLKLIISFADPSQSHHGGIYQASNFIYNGTSAPSYEYYDSKGRKWHPRQVSKDGFRKQFGALRPSVRADECTKVRVKGKHRYLYAFDNDLRQQILKESKKYPKRASSIDSDA